MHEKLELLRKLIKSYGSCLIAFSGGVDSSFLFAVAIEELGDKALGVTACSETYPERELLAARAFANKLGGRHIEIISDELNLPQFRANPRNRCYYCKQELFTKLSAIALKDGINVLLDGNNRDDRNDRRPGRQAAKELGVKSPLDEVGLTKSEVRELSRQMGLPTWDKPATACLSSRFPYNVEITVEKLRQVGKAEEALHLMGFKTVRIRYHGDVARLELGEEEFKLATGDLRHETIYIVKSAGFNFVAIDLEGFRSGSMNTPE